LEKMRTIGYRLARITAALVVAVPAGLSMTTTAGAATCTATGFVRDGIYLTDGGSGVIDGNKVWAYQKGGIVVTLPPTWNGPATTATVTNNTVSGLGPVVFIAQNGIQVSRGAVAAVRGNSISDNFYTGEVGVGPNPGGQNPEGWEYFSTGLLLFEAGAGTKTADNQFSGNQHNFANVP